MHYSKRHNGSLCINSGSMCLRDRHFARGNLDTLAHKNFQRVWRWHTFDCWPAHATPTCGTHHFLLRQLVADGWCWFVLRGKYCWLVAGAWFVLREKYRWLVADKPNEQGGRQSFKLFSSANFHRNIRRVFFFTTRIVPVRCYGQNKILSCSILSCT
jgi:hypothetical protein